MFYIIYGDTPHAHSTMPRAFWPGQHMICAADAAIPLHVLISDAMTHSGIGGAAEAAVLGGESG